MAIDKLSNNVSFICSLSIPAVYLIRKWKRERAEGNWIEGRSKREDDSGL